MATTATFDSSIGISQARSIPIAQADPIAPDLAPAIAQLKVNAAAAAEALLLKLQTQSPDRPDIYQYLTFSRLLQGKYADVWIDGIDRGFQGKDNDMSGPPDWLAERVNKAQKFFETDPPPAFIEELERRVAAQPDAIGPRLALLIQFSRP